MCGSRTALGVGCAALLPLLRCCGSQEAEEAALAKLMQAASLEAAASGDGVTVVAAAAPAPAAAGTAGAAVTATAAAGAGGATAGGGAAANPKKRLRALRKKLRQIDALEDRVAAGGEALSEAEAAKVAGKAELEAEAAQLEKLV